MYVELYNNKNKIKENPTPRQFNKNSILIFIFCALDQFHL